MDLQQCVYLSFGLVMLVTAYRSDTWPTKELESRIDVEGGLRKCLTQSKVDREEVKRFELTTDFQHLPNSTALKAYMYCFMEHNGVFKPNSTRLNVANLMEQINELPKADQDIMFRMGAGCIRRTMNVRDAHEVAYLLNVCLKENDNVHYYFYY